MAVKQFMEPELLKGRVVIMASLDILTQNWARPRYSVWEKPNDPDSLPNYARDL